MNGTRTRILILFLLPLTATAQVSSGGAFTLEKSVVAAGGASNLAGGSFALGATAGQAGAGQSGAGSFALRGGFWEFQPLAPTAAMVTVGGRVAMENGVGIANARILLTDSSGATRVTVSNSFGNFTFNDVPAGETYIFTAMHRRFAFTNPTQVFFIADSRGDLEFTAFPD
jgi:hypothetical protein